MAGSVSRLRTPKPPHTIRVGVIGDSTSHNFYGRQLQTYLDAWAAAAQLGVKFQVLNGARQGLEQRDEEAVLKYELAPMGLDYIYASLAAGIRRGRFHPDIRQPAAWRGIWSSAAGKAGMARPVSAASRTVGAIFRSGKKSAAAMGRDRAGTHAG